MTGITDDFFFASCWSKIIKSPTNCIIFFEKVKPWQLLSSFLGFRFSHFCEEARRHPAQGINVARSLAFLRHHTGSFFYLILCLFCSILPSFFYEKPVSDWDFKSWVISLPRRRLKLIPHNGDKRKINNEKRRDEQK